VRERFPRIGGLLLALGGEPASERAWRRGAEGEERVGARLERLDGVVVLHDRRMPGSRANVDHIAIGPGGVTVIDTKNLAGRVEVRGWRRPRLAVGGSERPHLLDGIERQVAAVRAVARGVDVRGALCFADPSGLPLLPGRPRGIVVAGPRGVSRLARRPGPLGDYVVGELVARLERAFPPAGG
jgi:hypothetical protein